MAADHELNHEYLTILGLPAFSEASSRMLLGPELFQNLDSAGRLLSVQCLSGTGSIRVGADFFSSVLGLKSVLYSDPSWRTFHFSSTSSFVLEHIHSLDTFIDTLISLCSMKRITGWCSSTRASRPLERIDTGTRERAPWTLKECSRIWKRRPLAR